MDTACNLCTTAFYRLIMFTKTNKIKLNWLIWSAERTNTKNGTYSGNHR